MKTCSLCESKLIKEERIIPYIYKEQTQEILQSGDYCVECGEGFLFSKDLKAF